MHGVRSGDSILSAILRELRISAPHARLTDAHQPRSAGRGSRVAATSSLE
jgi:hypothetical protein